MTHGPFSETQAGTAAEFAHALKQHRQRAGMTQSRLAAQLGYHHSVVSRWESGSREPPIALVSRIDEVLSAGGALSAVLTDASRGRETSQNDDPGTPLPGASWSGLGGWDTRAWPTHLPFHGVTCPLHSHGMCEVPPADRAREIVLSVTADPPEHIDDELIHVMVAQLAICGYLVEHEAGEHLGPPVEAMLHVVVRLLAHVDERDRRVLVRLAAQHAELAARWRLLRGQYGVAMTLYLKALGWARLCDDEVLRVSLLCDTSTLTRLEGDGVTALSYAGAVTTIGAHRTWASTLSHLYQARAYGAIGDRRETLRHAASARGELGRLTAEQAKYVPWMAGDAGHVMVEAGIGGALRDIAAATDDRPLIGQALYATQSALDSLPSHVRQARLLLTLRLADCYACAGEPDAAVAVITPFLAELPRVRHTTVVHERLLLRQRLGANWPHLEVVRDFLDVS